MILSMASVAFSFKYFEGWFSHTLLPDWTRFALAGLATVLLSYMIGNLLNWVVASAIRGVWSMVLTVAAVLVGGLLAFDLYGNIVGGEMLAEVVIASAERGNFRYSEQQELDNLRAQVHRIDSTHTARNSKGEAQTWVSGAAKKEKNSLNQSIAYHEARKLKEQADFDSGYDKDVAKAEQRMHAANVGLYWFNLLMYIIMIGLYVLIHAIEVAVEIRTKNGHTHEAAIPGNEANNQSFKTYGKMTVPQNKMGYQQRKSNTIEMEVAPAEPINDDELIGGVGSRTYLNAALKKKKQELALAEYRIKNTPDTNGTNRANKEALLSEIAELESLMG